MSSNEALAALVRIPISYEVMRDLYRLGAVRPDREAEDLATVIPRLAAAVRTHGLRISN